MRETLKVACIHARKHRIRQRLDRYHYGRRPFRFARSKAITVAGALIILALSGMVAFHESMTVSDQVNMNLRSTR